MDAETVEIKDKPEKDRPESAAERKAELIRQGEFYRVGVVHSKAQVKYAARPENLFHSAVDHATWALRSRVDGLLQPTGASVATIMPYAMTVINFIRKRKMGKASLGVSLALAGIGFYLQRRRMQQAAYTAY